VKNVFILLYDMYVASGTRLEYSLGILYNIHKFLVGGIIFATFFRLVHGDRVLAIK